MKFIATLLTLALLSEACLAQLVYQQPIALQLAANHQNSGVPHKAVEINAAHESLLPPELLKSKKFYDDPRVAAALSKDSWFGDKESQVFEREAEKIPRERIYKLAKDAGFIRRR